MNKISLGLFFLFYVSLVSSSDYIVATHGYIAIDASEVKDVVECIECVSVVGTTPVIEVLCHNGRVIKSYPELGFLRTFYTNGIVEKTYIDREKYPQWDRVIKYPDRWRQIVFRDGRVFTEKPDGSYEKSNT